MGKNRTIVVSAINFFSGGPLTILNDCVATLAKEYSADYSIIVLVHNKNLISNEGVEIVEFEKSRSSWFYRLYYEYFYFKKYSKEIKPYLWLSLHDITPNVMSDRRAVYCHNPSPFYKVQLNEAISDPVFALFNKLYAFLYRKNIHENNYVIVQQNWLRDAFIKKFNVKNVIVAHPAQNTNPAPVKKTEQTKQNIKTFLYPALPRVFKNFELIGDAVQILHDKGVVNFEVNLTINGTENKYSKQIFEKYSKLNNLKFIGLQTKEAITELYSQTDCVVFPSKLETWGLPITEAKAFNKPILIINLPYAKETLGYYEQAKFFEPGDAAQLADFMEQIINGQLIVFDKTYNETPAAPFADSWSSLFEILLK